MTTARRPRWTALLVLALCTGLAACGGAVGQERRLTVYSGRTENLVGPLLEQFSERTGIGIDVNYGDSAELALLIATEGERSPADVFFSQSPGAAGFLGQRGQLAPLPVDVTDLVDPAWRDPQGLWVGTTGRQRVLVYNAQEVDPQELPTSVFDLTRPPFAGRVAVAPGNGSFQDFVSAMRVLRGDEVASQWLRALAQSEAPTYASNQAIVEAVARGEVAMGLVNHYYNYRFQAEDPTVPSRNYVFPGTDVGSLVIPSAVGVVASSDQPEDAAEFVRFLLSPEAQRFFAEQTYEYPLAAGVPPAQSLPPLAPGSSPQVDLGALGGGLEGTVQMIRASGLEGS